MSIREQLTGKGREEKNKTSLRASLTGVRTREKSRDSIQLLNKLIETEGKKLENIKTLEEYKEFYNKLDPRIKDNFQEPTKVKEEEKVNIEKQKESFYNRAKSLRNSVKRANGWKRQYLRQAEKLLERFGVEYINKGFTSAQVYKWAIEQGKKSALLSNSSKGYTMVDPKGQGYSYAKPSDAPKDYVLYGDSSIETAKRLEKNIKELKAKQIQPKTILEKATEKYIASKGEKKNGFSTAFTNKSREIDNTNISNLFKSQSIEKSKKQNERKANEELLKRYYKKFIEYSDKYTPFYYNPPNKENLLGIYQPISMKKGKGGINLIEWQKRIKEEKKEIEITDFKSAGKSLGYDAINLIPLSGGKALVEFYLGGKLLKSGKFLISKIPKVAYPYIKWAGRATDTFNLGAGIKAQLEGEYKQALLNYGFVGIGIGTEIVPKTIKDAQRLKYWLSKEYPFRADKLIVTEKGVALPKLRKTPNMQVEIPSDPIKKEILLFAKEKDAILGGSRSIEAHGVKLSRYRKSGIKTSDIDLLFKSPEEANKMANEIVKRLNKKYGKNRFSYKKAEGEIANAQISDSLTKEHYDFVAEKVPTRTIDGFKVLKIEKQIWKKGEALRNPERIYRSYDPIKRDVRKDFTDFVDITKSEISDKIKDSWFLKKSSKDYITYNVDQEKLLIEVEKTPKKIRNKIKTKYNNKKKIDIDELKEIIDKEEYKYLKKGKDYLKKYHKRYYYPKKENYLNPPKYYKYEKKKDYKYPREYKLSPKGYYYYPPYKPIPKKTIIKPTFTLLKNKSKGKRKPIIISKSIKKKNAYVPIIHEGKIRKELKHQYSTRKEAIAEAMIHTDNEPAYKFGIKRTDLEVDRLRGGRDTNLKYKFKRKGQTYIEKIPYRRDKGREKRIFDKSKGKKYTQFNISPYVFTNRRENH